MRTTAEAPRSPAAASREPAAARRRGGAAAAGAPPEPVPALAASSADAASVSVTSVRMLRIDEGLYVLRVGELSGPATELSGINVPAAYVSVPFAGDGNGVEIVASFPHRGAWVRRSGGTLVLRSARAGGSVLVTAYGAPAAPQTSLSLDLRRLDGPGSLDDLAVAAGAPSGTRTQADPHEVPTEVLLHIERAGDRLFPGRGWVGALGRRMRIEAFSIRPTERLAPADLEMKGYLPNGGETPWIPGGLLCGTRGRGLPLIGFALRITPQRADRFEVSYQGSFFAGGISEPQQNGSPCRAAQTDDPLEAINVRITDKQAEDASDPSEPAG